MSVWSHIEGCIDILADSDTCEKCIEKKVLSFIDNGQPIGSEGGLSYKVFRRDKSTGLEVKIYFHGNLRDVEKDCVIIQKTKEWLLQQEDILEHNDFVLLDFYAFVNNTLLKYVQHSYDSSQEMPARDLENADFYVKEINSEK